MKVCCFMQRDCNSVCMAYFEDVHTGEPRCKRLVDIDNKQPMFIPANDKEI